MKKKFLVKYLILDLVYIAMLAALATAFKSIAGTLVRLITGSLGIPGGALAGGLYMMWLAIGHAIVNKFGVSTLISLIQALVLFVSGAPGSHGVWTFVTYLIPGIAVDLVFLCTFKKREHNILHYMIAVILANILGTYGSNLLWFRLSWLPLAFTLTGAALSGAIGGIIAYQASKLIKKIGI